MIADMATCTVEVAYIVAKPATHRARAVGSAGRAHKPTSKQNRTNNRTHPWYNFRVLGAHDDCTSMSDSTSERQSSATSEKERLRLSPLNTSKMVSAGSSHLTGLKTPLPAYHLVYMVTKPNWSYPHP